MFNCPEKNVGDFVVSKIETNANKLPWHVLDYPRMNLERSRRELALVESHLEDKRQEFREKHHNLSEQWRDLAHKEAALKESFIKFSQFIKDNGEKRKRTQQQLEDNVQFTAEKIQQIEGLKTKIQQMKLTKTEMDQKIRSHKIYENYLYDAIMEDASFKDINEILARYEEYVSTRNYLGYRQEKAVCALEQAKNKMSKMTAVNNLAIVGLRNQMSTLQGRYEEAMRKSRRWENVVLHIKENLREKNEEIFKVKTSIWNNYLRMCWSKQVSADVPIDNVEQQLIYIKRTLKDMASVRSAVGLASSRSK